MLFLLQMSERQDTIGQLKAEIHELEEKRQGALASLSQHDSSLTQLRGELKQTEKRVGC